MWTSDWSGQRDGGVDRDCGEGVDKGWVMGWTRGWFLKVWHGIQQEAISKHVRLEAKFPFCALGDCMRFLAPKQSTR